MNTMPPIELDTPRLLLRLMQPSDLDGLLKIFGDPIVMDSFNEPPFTREQMEWWLQRNLSHQEEFGYGLFSVILKSENLLIGDCGLEHMDVEGEQKTELGYDFCSDHWNQGYATEAACAVRDFAFHTLKLPGLISLIRKGNRSSRRVAEKIGMKLEEEITRYNTSYWVFSMLNPAE
jgi:RimJ/RimL family protein N-acetyltransferase